MINNVILVGKLMNEPEMVPTRDQIPSKWTKFVLAVERPFKNRQNQFEIDFVAIKTWVANTDELKTLLKKNAIIGIKGRIQTFANKTNDFYHTEIIADKITYLG